MLFETANRRPAVASNRPESRPMKQPSAASRPASRPVQQSPTTARTQATRPGGYNTTSRSTQPARNPGTGRPPLAPNTLRTARTTAPGRSNVQQRPMRPQDLTTARLRQQYVRPGTGSSPQPPLRTRTAYPQGVRRSLTTTSTSPRRGRPVTTSARRTQPANKTWVYGPRGIRVPQLSNILRPAPPRKIYPYTGVRRPRYVPGRGWIYYEPTVRQYINYYGSDTPPVYPTTTGATPVQQPINGEPSPYTAPPPSGSPTCTCKPTAPPQTVASPPTSPYTAPPAEDTKVQDNALQQSVKTRTIQANNGTQKQLICHSCGSSTRGCVMLKSFAFNSTQLNAYHRKQLRSLAKQILQQNINAIVATGYTDSSQTEDVDQNLGERRAWVTIAELKRQLARLKPNAHKNLFWKTDAGTDPTRNGGNTTPGSRRVELCIRQLR